MCVYKGLTPFLNSTISTEYVRAITSLARTIQNTRDRSFVLETKAKGKSDSFRKIKKRTGGRRPYLSSEEIP